MTGERVKSEDIIINAPMSFAGAWQRTMRRRRYLRLPFGPAWMRALPMTLVVCPVVLVTWWAAVAVWYVCFGVLLVPYRMLRRGTRKRKAEAARHREILSAIRDPKQ